MARQSPGSLYALTELGMQKGEQDEAKATAARRAMGRLERWACMTIIATRLRAILAMTAVREREAALEALCGELEGGT